jgi:cytochrome c5
LRYFLLSALALGLLAPGLLVVNTAQAASAPEPYAQSKQPGSVKNAPERTGDDVFQTHCVRCHNPPMTLSPRVTGTVVMHMRARARLSREDEILLLKYLAP